MFRFLCLFMFSCLSFFASATDFSPIKLEGDEYLFTKLTPISEVEKRVEDKVLNKLSMPMTTLDTLYLSRLYTSDWFSIMLNGDTYMMDNSTNYWVKTSNADVFSFTPNLQRMAVSNSVREDLLKMMPLLEGFEEMLPVYPSSTKSRNIKIWAFVDMTCPYCRKFHLTNRLQLQNVGVTFVYVPFSRSPGEKRADGANLNAFCGAPGDVKKDIDDYYLMETRLLLAKNLKSDCEGSQEILMDFLLHNGERFSLVGSPMFLTESGVVIYGADTLTQYVSQYITQ